MARHIEIGDQASLLFPPGPRQGTLLYVIRNIQIKPDRIDIYLRRDIKSKILTLIGRNIEFSDEIEPIEVTFTGRPDQPEPEVFRAERDRDHLRELVEMLDNLVDEIEIAQSVRYNVDTAVAHGDIRTLRYLLGSYPEFFSTTYVINKAATEGQLEVLEWLNESDPDFVQEAGIRVANIAAEYGYMNTIEYLESLDPPIRPDQAGVEAARLNNHLDIVEHVGSVPLTKSARKR